MEIILVATSERLPVRLRLRLGQKTDDDQNRHVRHQPQQALVKVKRS